MDIVCEFCAREVRKSEQVKHYQTHAETWSHTANDDIKHYCFVNKKPLMFQICNVSGTVPWVVCLGCRKFTNKDTKKFIVDHDNDCYFEKWKHLYQLPRPLIGNDMVSIENEVLKENLKNLKSKLKKIVSTRITELKLQLSVANTYKNELEDGEEPDGLLSPVT